ncbi:MAG: putative secreted protein, TENGU-like protein [Candidatus Phytoplasma asteris]|nr:MAG: tengu-su inducer [Periwinkle leaf yellowing phytoplasma]WEX19702.1 MAG: putative secreted protein, TENGU-like protein [Candidatus Phytoplasma asteris]BAN15031.1 tengu-su inducer [Garlic yellows phytoplasma]BAN15034.1 tengu-su inducer [Onion yellows phytoplasma]
MVKLKKNKAKLLIFAGFLAILLFLNHNYLIFADQDDDIENVITLIETKENQTEQIKIQCQDLLQKGEKDA